MNTIAKKNMRERNPLLNTKRVFRPLIASSLALALGVSVGIAQNIGGSYPRWYKPSGISMNENAYAVAYTNGMFDPWNNSVSDKIVWTYNQRIYGNSVGDFQLRAKNSTVEVQGMIDIINGMATLNFQDSYLRFSDAPTANGDHYLRSIDGGASIKAAFNGGSGRETIGGTTWNNVAFYGAIIHQSNNANTNNVSFQNGANMLGLIKMVGTGAYINSNYTFTGGGNLIAIDTPFYISNGNNIQNSAIDIRLSVAVNPVTNNTLNITFGTSGKVEVVDTTNKSSALNDNGTVKTTITSANSGGITSVVSASATQTIITNMIKGNLYIGGFGNQQTITTVNFYNNGIVDGNINLFSNSTLNLYFANEGTIRSNLVFEPGSDNISGGGLIIKKTQDNNVVEKLTFDGSIRTLTAFSAEANDLNFIGNSGNDGKTIEIKNSGGPSKGNITLTSHKNANFNINRLSNGYKANFNLNASDSGSIFFHSQNNIDTSLGEAATNFNFISTGYVADANKYDIDFLSGNINNPGTTNFNLQASNSGNAQKVKFQTGNINSSGTFNLALTTKMASSSATFTTGNISNSGSMNFNFGSTTAPLTFTAGTISNSNSFTFTPNSGNLTLKAAGIHTTGGYNANTTTTLKLGNNVDFATSYVATATTGATTAQLNTTLTATATNGQNLILSAIDLSSTAQTLALKGIGESNGIVNGSDKYVLFTGKGTQKQEVQLNFNHSQNSNALVIGEIYTYSGSNNLSLKDTANTDAQADFIGNIQSRGNTNLYFENTLWAPTNIAEIIASMSGGKNATTASQNVMKYIATYGTGKVTTSGGTTNIAVNNVDVSFGDKTAVYQVDTSAGGNVNIAIKGATNIGAGVKYNTNTGNSVNLIFAATANKSTIDFNSTNAGNNQFFGVAYQDGVKLTLQDYQVSDLGGTKASFLQKARNAMGIDSSINDMSFTTKRTSSAVTTKSGGTAYTDTITLDGIAVGTIQPLTRSTSGTSDTYNFNVTLTKDSIFAGNIDIHGTQKSIEITMNQGSKIFAHNNRLLLNKLTIASDTQHDSATLLQNSFAQKNTTIDLATAGNDFANIASRNAFNLLVIGNTTDTNNQAGLSGNNALFRVYVNPNANDKLGDQELSVTGNTGADRVVILSGSAGKHYIQAIYDADSNVSNIAYYGGGTETEGNIAVATVKTGTSITMEGARQIQGFDLIETALTTAKTDAGGQNNDSGEYTTYFLESVLSTGASPINADTTASAMGLNYDLFIANFNSLNKRMGELRNNDNGQGAWGRIFNGMLNTSYGLETTSMYTTIQAGYDYAFGFEGANNYLGIALSYANSMSKTNKMLDYDGVEKGLNDTTTHGVEVALYNSYVEDSGWFNDTIVKFSYMMSDLSILGQDTTYNATNYGLVFSDEFGYRFKLGGEKEWYIDPQLEVGFGYFNQSNLKQVLGEASLDGIQDAIMTLRTRAGANWAYDFKRFTQGKGINASVYVGTYYSYDYINGGEISLTTNLGKNTSLTPLASTGRFELNVGTNIEIKDNTRIYFDFERSFGGTITTEYQVNVGVRYSFGENTGYKPVDPNKKEITPLKVSEEKTEESKEVEKTESNTQEKSTENKTEEEKAQ